MNDPISTIEKILKRNGHDVNLRENEADRYFLFDQISKPGDLDLAWAQVPEHHQIRARAAEVDAVSNIIPGFGYRTPKKSNHCSDAELVGLIRGHIAAIRPLISDCSDVTEFIDAGFDVQIVGSEVGEPPDPMENVLFVTLHESMGDFTFEHYAFDEPILEVLKDWAVYLTKCDEVASYLLWPVLKGVEAIDTNTPVPGFRLWQYNCRTRYWIKDGDVNSGLVFIQPPWAR